ncbi:MAG TPA: hypothetical protein VGS19_30450 [Streptosporangiaceae bacterium]|nr:hypothetical protein [Streptosporangiaceae bacterium]
MAFVPSAAEAAHLGVSGLQWAQDQHAQGAKLRPTHGNDVDNLLQALKPTACAGTAQSVDVYYSEAGQHYHRHNGFTVKVQHRKCG